MSDHSATSAALIADQHGDSQVVLSCFSLLSDAPSVGSSDPFDISLSMKLKCCDLYDVRCDVRAVIVWSTNFGMVLVFATNF
jgi:hypothetical protein